MSAVSCVERLLSETMCYVPRVTLTLLEVSRHICRPIKGYTDIYVILTYTGTETHVSFGLFI